MNEKLKPIPLWLALIYFGIPGAVLYYGCYGGVQLLHGTGVSLLAAFMAFTWIPTLALIPVVLILYQREGDRISPSGFRERFRLSPIEGKMWFWVLGALAVNVMADAALHGTGKWLASMPAFAPPDYLPGLFNPLVKMFPVTDLFGTPLRGNWWILAAWIPLHTLAMFGEELMWRGYILPRQEVSYKRYAWLVNGLLWAFILHACLKWQYIGMLPGMLIVPLVAQKTRSTWASVFVHVLSNAPIWVILLLGVLGVNA